jgi:hypothetical protein
MRRMMSVLVLLSAVLTVLTATLVTTTPAGATVRDTEFPYNNRTCNSYYDITGDYRLDACVEIGFSGHNHVGQVVLACRTGDGQERYCASMTVNNAQLRGCSSPTGPCSTTLREWSDGVANVKRYVSYTPTPSFDCLNSPYWGTKVVATVSVRFPNGNAWTGIQLVSTEETQYCI